MHKPNLLLLHGALGASDQFALFVPILAERYQIHLLDFEGHGRALMPPRPFRMDHFGENVLSYLQQHSIERVHIFGYSMGGYVACKLALAHPQLVENIATLGTKYHWDKQIAAREVALLDPQKIAAKVPLFAHALAERHVAAGWEYVLAKTSDLLLSLGEQGGLTAQDLGSLQQRVRVMVGDRDTTVSVIESTEVYQALPRGELEVLPNTPHPLEKISPARLTSSLTEFIRE